MWAVSFSMYDGKALCGMLYHLCMIHRRYVGCYILYADSHPSMWADIASMFDAYALCRLLHPLTLTITIKKVQSRARNPKSTK